MIGAGISIMQVASRQRASNAPPPVVDGGLNPADKSDNINVAFFSESPINTQAAHFGEGDGSGYSTIRSVVSHSTGKWFFDGRVTNVGGGTPSAGIIGLATAGMALDDVRVGTPANTAALYLIEANGDGGDTEIFANDAVIGGLNIPYFDSTGVLCAVDFDAGKMWFGSAGAGWKDAAGNAVNPALGDAATVTFTPNTLLHACLCLGFTGEWGRLGLKTATLLSGNLAMKPSGFSVWAD